jgi:Pentapeptide repeats (8 copies)
MSKLSLPKIKTIRRLLKWLITILALTVILGLLQPTLWPGGSGIGKDQSISTKSVETVVKDAQGNTTKTIETTKNDDGKTIWDWLSLLGVPTSLAILGYRLQQIQQKRAEEVARAQRNRDEALAKEQRQIAADETKEEVLQVYFDRLSGLLVDKNLMAIAAKGNQATDVIRTRTLSILRRFENDSERKTSVIRFLIEADFVSKLRLNLSGADLSGADLSDTDLSGANLSSTNLNSANLSDTDLVNTNLGDANLSDAYLANANLHRAILSGATP